MPRNFTRFIKSVDNIINERRTVVEQKYCCKRFPNG